MPNLVPASKDTPHDGEASGEGASQAQDEAQRVQVTATRKAKTLPLHLSAIALTALVVGVAQLVAATTLELASPGQLAAAQARGPIALWWLLASVVLGSASVYTMRARPERALLSGLLWSGATAFGVYRGSHGGDLAFYGEPVAYHLLAMLCTALVWGVCWRWIADRELGDKKRAIPAVLACTAATILLLEHLSSSVACLAPLGQVSVFSGVARMLALLSWPAALWIFWPHFREVSARWVPLLGSLLLTLRVALAGPEGLLGATVGDAQVPILGAAFVVVSMATAVSMRPRLGLLVHIVLALVSLAACMLLLSVYYADYGRLEDGLSGILRSLFGFDVPLPFPQQPGWWHAAVVMVGIFFLFYAAYAAIVSSDDRRKGVALGLMLLGGLNLLSPYLVLMLCAGGLFFVEALIVEARRDKEASLRAASSQFSTLLDALATRLGVDAPVRIAGQRGEVLKVFGLLADRPFEVLIRSAPGKRAQGELVAGVLGRGDAALALIPDRGTRGERPSHLLARSHRIKGEVRLLETLGEQPLDALLPFEDARLQLWEGGVFCEFGPSIEQASIDEVEALLRAAAKSAGAFS